MPWLRLRTPAAPAGADDVAEQLANAGAVAVTLLPAAAGGAGRWPVVAVEGLFPLQADLSRLPRLRFETDFLADPKEKNWANTWRDSVRPLRFGRLHVVPRDHPADRPGEPILRLDPGLAFGTGTHPTTAQCLGWLAANLVPGQRVLDVGCGSGILGLAAYKLGAGAVAAVDYDPQARTATTRNAADNEVPLSVVGHLGEVRGRYDVGVANILATTLCALSAELAPRVEQLVLAGLLPGQAPQVAAAYPQFAFEPPTVTAGWALLCGRRAAPARNETKPA